MDPLEDAGFYTQGQILGRGWFGITYKGWHQVGEEERSVAIKVVPKKKFRDYRRDTECEVLSLLKKVSDAENIVTMIKCIADTSDAVEDMYIVLEYCNQGNLAKYLSKRLVAMRLPHIQHVLRQIVRGLEVIHRNAIIHRDLKPDNILLHAEGNEKKITGWTVKLADFGLSKILKTERMKTSTERMGSHHYAAPEVLSVQPEGYGQQADLWSLGVVLYECYMKTLPYGNRTAEDLLELYTNSNPTPKFSLRWYSSSRTLDDLINRLLQVDAEKRPTIGQLVQDPFVSGAVAAAQPNLPTPDGT